MKKLFTFLILVAAAYNASAICHANMTNSAVGLAVTFTNTSTPPTHSGAMTPLANWDFGDASYSSTWSPSHTYAAAGTYMIRLYVEWLDSVTSTHVCDDTLAAYITVSATGGIDGHIVRDSAYSPGMDSIMVWLITYDTTTHIISAVDSQRVSALTGYTHYSFSGVTPGSYLLKAASMSGTSGSGFVPTYHSSSLHWNTAGYVVCTTSTVATADIFMAYGTVTSGPGFIGGDVRLGAGKGTAVGDPVVGLTIYLINTTTGKLVAATKTDAAGNYSFNNVPYGTYDVSPEQAPLASTPWSSLVVSSSGTTSISNINFLQNSTSIKPKPSGVAQVSQLMGIAVYPNPAHGQLNIQWNGSTEKTADITITNITGQKLLHTTLSINNTNSQLNVSALQPGTYFININTAAQNYNDKLIIK